MSTIAVRRSRIETFVPPGNARAMAIRSEVVSSRKAGRFRRAIRTVPLIGGRMARFLILTIYGRMGERGQGARAK